MHIGFSTGIKRTIGVSPIDTSTEPRQYGTPVEYTFNLLPTTASADMFAYGTGYSQRYRAVCNKAYAADIHELDMAYIDVDIPETSDKLGKQADYYVESKLDSVLTTQIIFNRKVNMPKP